MIFISCQAEFQTQVVTIQERRKEREQEVQGAWYTEERMQTELSYSKSLVSVSSRVSLSKDPHSEGSDLLQEVPDLAAQAHFQTP